MPSPWLERLLPVVVFLLAITVVAEVAESQGCSTSPATGPRTPAGTAAALWLLLALLAACHDRALLDTTAVLLTPVGLAVARQVGLDAVPFVGDHAVDRQHRARCCCPCPT